MYPKHRNIRRAVENTRLFRHAKWFSSPSEMRIRSFGRSFRRRSLRSDARPVYFQTNSINPGNGKKKRLENRCALHRNRYGEQTLGESVAQTTNRTRPSRDNSATVTSALSAAVKRRSGVFDPKPVIPGDVPPRPGTNSSVSRRAAEDFPVVTLPKIIFIKIRAVRLYPNNVRF